MSILSEPVKHDLSDILKELKFGRPKADQDLIDKWMKELEPCFGNVSGSCFKILDKDGIEMPDHYSGRRRTYEEAKRLLDYLNENGEHGTYTMVEV